MSNLTFYILDTDPLPAFILADIVSNSFSITQAIVLGIALVCLMLSGFVSGSEISLFSLTQSNLEELDESPSGAIIRKLLSHPQRFLATILITNNLVNVAIVVLTNFALGPVFSGMEAWLSFVLQTVLLTFIILLFGEILPKLYANSHPVKWAKVVAPGLAILSILVAPLARMLEKSSTFVRRVVSKQVNDISTEELSRALELTQDTTGGDKEMLEGILKFGDTTAAEIMRPRVDITWLNTEMDFEEILRVVLDSGYSRVPVYGDSQDDVRGILYSRDLLPYIGKEYPDNFSWLSLLRPVHYVPESRMIDDLLEDFRKMKQHMAVVVDEYGGTQGIVTMEDVLEEIVGDIDDEYDEPEQTFKRLPNDTYIFEGRTTLSDFFRITALDPDDYAEVSEDSETLAGMLLAIKGDFPEKRETLVYGQCRFLVQDMSEHRIATVRVKVMPEKKSE